jgi:hypothetical protein
VTEIRPAPKHLALLAVNMRGWDYEEIYGAIIAAGHAGWSFDQVYREVTRMILIDDEAPASLRHKAAKPTLAAPTGAAVNTRGKELVMEAYRQTKGAQQQDTPEGGEAA